MQANPDGVVKRTEGSVRCIIGLSSEQHEDISKAPAFGGRGPCSPATISCQYVFAGKSSPHAVHWQGTTIPQARQATVSV